MSLMSTVFMWLSCLLLSEVVMLSGVTSTSLSRLNTEIPVTGLSVCVTALSSAGPCSESDVIGVHLRLDEFTASVAWLTEDLELVTSLQGADNDANFCARIFTGKLQTAPIQRHSSYTTLSSSNSRSVLSFYVREFTGLRRTRISSLPI